MLNNMLNNIIHKSVDNVDKIVDNLIYQYFS